MLEEHLNNIRKKPKAVRSQYAMAAASVFTGVLALVWATTLPDRFAVESVDPYVRDQLAAAAAAAEEENLGGVSAFFGSLRDGVAALIFNLEPEEPIAEPVKETNIIDIDALLRESSTTEPAMVPAVDATTTSTSSAPLGTTTPATNPAGAPASSTQGTAPVGEVILIGTTSSQKNVPTTP